MGSEMCIRDSAKGTDGSIAILKGNLAPEGCVIKHTACPKNMFEATLRAKPYDSEEACIAAVLHGEVKPGDAIFIRYEGPRGSGMPEMFYTGEAICADPKLASSVALITDCLLYTSDAADEEDSVDLGGRRTSKKKKRRDELRE